MGKPLVLHIFGHKQKYMTNYNFNLMMVLDEESGDYQSDYNSSHGEHAADNVAHTVCGVAINNHHERNN